MKVARHMRLLLIVLFSTTLFSSAFAQSLYWQGQTENWSDIDNWSSEKGERAKDLPNAETHVFFPSERSGSVTLDLPRIHVASITTLYSGEIYFAANQPSTLKVDGSLNLGEGTTLSPNVKIQLTGEGFAHPNLSISENAESHLTSIPNNYERIESSVGTRGSCPFFDLTPDPTPPTCNGFEDGIASVLEPTTGVGPYTYQWIGGPGTREWTDVGAGTYTVIVFDQGQGASPCNVDVFVNEPGPLTVFSLSPTAPTCANVCNGQAAPIIIGGNGGYNLTWSSGETGFTPSALCATFTLTIEDSEGCTADTTVIFDNIPDPILIDEVVTDITCFGFNDGNIEITASGGTGNLSYSWTGPSGFSSISEDISNLAPGDYTIEVTDDNGCTVDETYTISENPPLLVSATSVNNLCNGDNTGSIDLTIAGGLAPYDVSWTGPSGFSSTDQDISSLLAGTYEVTVTDASNCVVVIQETVDQPAPLTADVTPTNLSCFENNSGQITVAAQGGTPGYNYSWTGPDGFFASGPTIIGLSAGTYSLTVTDNNDCVFTLDVDILQPDEIILDFAETPISCNGNSDGEIDLSVSGGTPPFSFSWTGPGGFTSSAEDISGLSTGTYTVEVTDFNGCTMMDSYELQEPLLIGLTATVTDPDCAGASNGGIDLTVANGTPPYDISWSGPAGFSSTNEDISNLTPGDYTVVVTDAGTCSATDTYTVSEPSGLSATFELTSVSCFGGSDGAIITTPSGGAAPYTYLWLGPAGFFSMDQNHSDLVAGEYSLLLNDANGCDGFFIVNITQPTNISVSNTITDVSCFGGSDGSINITSSGASSPYSFDWVGPDGFSASSQNIAGLSAGDYVVLITDANDCEFSRTYTVDEPNEINISPTITDVVCAGDNTGAIDIAISGGSPAFSVSWTGPNGFTAITEDISNLEVGTYTVDLIDAAGCNASASFDVQELFDISVGADLENVSCFGSGDGSIDITAAGGSAPYTYDWTGPDAFTSIDEDLTDLQAGIYNVQVSDDNGCTGTAQVEITEPGEIVLNTVVSDIECFGANDGSITLTTSGGTGVLNFSWTGPNGFTSTNQNLTNLEPGDYDVLVEDENGCSSSASVAVSQNPELIVSAETFDSNCLQSDGLAVATASGGTGTLTFSWENEAGIEIATNDSLIDVPSGTYQVVVTDDLGCSVGVTVVISDSNGTLTGVATNPTCANGNDGAIDADLTGGTAPFDYEWTDGNGFTSNQEDISDLSSGTYILTITDANDCVFSGSFELTDPPAISVLVSTVQASCNGSDGSIDLTIENAAEPFDIEWTGPNGFMGTGASISDLEIGTYGYTLTDALGCDAFGSVSLSAAPAISVAETIVDVTCAGDANGAIDIEPSGGVAPLEFSWTGPDGFTSTDEDISGLTPGEYSLVVTDQTTCVENQTYTITEPDAIVVDIVINEPDCNQANGSLEASITGGTVTGTYTINWEDDLGNSISNSTLAENLAQGMYTIIVIDDNGCSYEEEIALSNSGGDIVATISPENCAGANDGAIALEVSGVSEPFTVSWTGPDGFSSNDEDITNLPGGIYTYVITGADGCVFSESLEVLSPEALDVIATIANTCSGAGLIEIEITGGDEPYSINWSGPNGFSSTQSFLDNLLPGEYSLQVADDSGCEFSSVYTIIESSELQAEILSQNVVCFGESNGEVDLTLSGGNPPYAVEWSGPDGFTSTEQDLTSLTEGEYALTVLDSIGCLLQDTVTISQPEELSVIEDITASGCSDTDNSGSISLFPQGGQLGYMVSWTGPNGFTSSLFDIGNLETGTYDYVLTDLGGCSISNSIEIVEVETLTLSSNSIDLSCFESSDGRIETEVLGGISPYEIEWTGPDDYEASTDTIEGLAAGEYSLTVNDQAGCELRETIVLIEPEPISVEFSTTAGTCVNVADGTIEAAVIGGTAPYTYEWAGPDGFESDQENIASLITGAYVLTVADANDCQVSDTANVDVIFDINVNAGPDTALCPSSLPVVLDGELVGGDSFYWVLEGDTISSTSQVTIDETFEAITELILIGSNGACSQTDTLTIELLESPEVDAGEDLRVFIEEVFTLGGSPTSTDEVTYLWMPNPMSVFDSSSANPTGFLLESEDFVVTVTDLNGCQSADTVFVEVLPDIEVTSGFTPNGDGANDTWIIDNIELFPAMVVHVFNRWGVEVFESQGYNANIAWDGTYNGSVLPSGTYYYTIELNDARFPDPITGPITLHR